MFFTKMEWFCILPFDLVRLLIEKYLDPKTRLNMIQTCCRLHKTFFTLLWQRKWLMLCKEPPNLKNGTIHPKFIKCDKCGACMYNKSFKKHKCFAVGKIDYSYCTWCTAKLLPNVNHDLNKCLQSKNARCSECATWHGSESCAFKQIRCYNKIHDGQVSHRYCEFEKCEICKDEFCNGTLICPNVVPRCTRHDFYKCKECCALIDPYITKTHICVLLLDRLKVYTRISNVKTLSDQVYLFTNMYSATVTLFVNDVFKIPSLLPYEQVEVKFFSEDEPGRFDFMPLVKFERDCSFRN